MTHTFKTSPMVCSRQITIDLNDKDGTIEGVGFLGGCPGSLTAISKLVVGMKAEQAIKTLRGVRCAGKPTSCPDQLAIALTELTQKKA